MKPKLRALLCVILMATLVALSVPMTAMAAAGDPAASAPPVGEGKGPTAAVQQEGSRGARETDLAPIIQGPSSALPGQTIQITVSSPSGGMTADVVLRDLLYVEHSGGWSSEEEVVIGGGSIGGSVTYTYRVVGDAPFLMLSHTAFFVDGAEIEGDIGRWMPETTGADFSLIIEGPQIAVGGGGVELTIQTNAAQLEAELALEALEFISAENGTVKDNRLTIADSSVPTVLNLRVAVDNGPGTVGCGLTNVRYRMSSDEEWANAEDVFWKADVPCSMENIPTPLPQPNPGSTLRFKAGEDGAELLTGWTCEYPRTVQGLADEFLYTMGGGMEVYDPDGNRLQPEDSLKTGCVLRLTPGIGPSRDSIIVLTGDPLGTGKNEITQLVKTAQFLSGSATPTSVQLAACDWNGSGGVDISDLANQAKMLTHQPLPLPTDRPNSDPEPQPGPGETGAIRLAGGQLETFLNDVCAPLALSALRQEIQEGKNAGEIAVAQQDAHFWDRYLYALMETQEAAEKFGADAVQYDAEYSLKDFYPNEDWSEEDRNKADLVDGEAVRQFIRTVFGTRAPEDGLLAPGSDKYVFWSWEPGAHVEAVPQLTELTADSNGNLGLEFAFSGEQFGGQSVRCRMSCHLERSELSPLGCVVTSYSVVRS